MFFCSCATAGDYGLIKTSLENVGSGMIRYINASTGVQKRLVAFFVVSCSRFRGSVRVLPLGAAPRLLGVSGQQP